MGKTNEEKLNKWLAEVKNWEKVRDEAIAKLTELAGIGHKTSEINPLPDGISLGMAVLEVFKENSDKSLKITDVVKKIKVKYNSNQDRKNVQSTIRYLTVNKKSLEKVPNTRGLYRLVKTSA